MNLPLSGIRVLCAARYMPAGYCTMLLADAGAEVILLEQPGGTDERITNPAVFASINRNKKSFAVNLKTDKGKEICQKLAQESDVFIEGFRPGVVSRLGMDYETLSKINPKLVYISISGFGQDGPYRLKSGHDLSYQGMVGLLSALYSPKEQRFNASLTGLGDLAAGMFANISILTALYGAKQTGKGQYIDLAMVDGMLSWMSVWITEDLKFRALIYDYGYNVYKTRDNKYITLSMVKEDHFWRNLCKVIDREDLSNLSMQEREERTDDLGAILKDIFLTRTRDEWVDILTKADVPSGPLYDSMEEVFNDPQLVQRDMIFKEGANKLINSPLKFQDIPRRAGGHVPGMGEHTAEILSQLLGITENEINQLKQSQVI